MTKLEDLIYAIRYEYHSDMTKVLNEMSVEELNAKHIDKNRYNEQYIGTALHAACLVNNTYALVALLERDGIDVNSTFIIGLSSFTKGCYWRGILIDHNYNGYTPIMMAATMKHKESFEILVQDHRVDLKAAFFVNGKETSLSEILKGADEEKLSMREKMRAAIEDKSRNVTKNIEMANIEMAKTTEQDILIDIQKNLGELLDSGEMSDFKIICGEEVFCCHKLILLTRSNVLKSMFNNDMKESNEDCMTIYEMEPSIVKSALKFIYTGKVSVEDINENASKLLEVADRYDLKGLTKLCETQLVPTINNNNVFEMIVMADMYHADILRKFAIMWIKENRFTVIKQDGLEEVLKKFPKLVFDMFDALSTKT